MSHAAVLVALDDAKDRNLESLVQWEMAPFDENGECFKDGSRWDWWKIGGRYSGGLLGKDTCFRRDISLEQMIEFGTADAKMRWAKIQADTHAPDIKQLIFGVEPNITEEQFIARECRPSWYSFLRNRTWHESERLGWFGGTARTECEIATGDEPKGKCLHQDEKTGAKIVVWNEPSDKWTEKYWKRFIEPLAPDTLLAIVDYHV